MIISGSITIPRGTFCFHLERYDNASFCFGVMLHERFDLSNGWVNINLGKMGFQLTLTIIKEG